MLALRRARHLRVGPLAVSWVPGDRVEPPRVAYAIGKRVGSAVVRNRLRRRLRMLIREAGPRLSSGAYLVGVSPDVNHLSYDDLRIALMRALDKVSARR